MTVTTSAAAPEQSAVSDFDDYVRFRSAALLRTAYLLTHDAALAEDLLQTSLAKAWFAWSEFQFNWKLLLQSEVHLKELGLPNPHTENGMSASLIDLK